MANFRGTAVKAKGVPGTLLTEKKDSGRISVSLQFKVEPGELGDDENGRPIKIGGQTVTWFSTITDKTRARTIESLELVGLPMAAAEKLISMAEAGQCGKTSTALVGTNVVALKCEIETYEGKTNTKVQWVNSLAGRRTKASQAEELDLGDVLQAAPKAGIDEDIPF